jgi:hypothetical protein
MMTQTTRPPGVTAVAEATCTDSARTLGLIQGVALIVSGGSTTKPLMAQAGRSSRAVLTEAFDVYAGPPAAGSGDTCADLVVGPALSILARNGHWL